MLIVRFITEYIIMRLGPSFMMVPLYGIMVPHLVL